MGETVSQLVATLWHMYDVTKQTSGGNTKIEFNVECYHVLVKYKYFLIKVSKKCKNWGHKVIEYQWATGRPCVYWTGARACQHTCVSQACACWACVHWSGARFSFIKVSCDQRAFCLQILRLGSNFLSALLLEALCDRLTRPSKALHGFLD